MEQAPFLKLDEAAYDQLKTKILNHWAEIQAIAAQVPDAQTVIELLRQVHGPASVSELGLTPAEQRLVEETSHYLRNRFTIRKLMRVLGLS